MVAIFDLAITTLAAALWYVRPELGPWPLLLVVAGVLSRRLADRPLWRRTTFDGPLLLFLLSAVFGALIAYAPDLAWNKFWVIVGGIVLYYSLVFAPDQATLGDRKVEPVRLLLAILPAVISLYFLLSNDWSQGIGKFAVLNAVAAWLDSHAPSIPSHQLHPNVAGGMMAALLPLQLAALRRSPWPAWLLVGVTGVGLLLSASRGAWVALATGMGVWAVWWLMVKRSQMGDSASKTRATWFLLAAVGLALVVMALVAVGVPQVGQERLSLLDDSLDLALDYPLTGVGLKGFPAAFSAYTLLLHVDYIVHSHNLFLNVWLEQGILGLAALLWLLVAALRVRSHSLWHVAALASLTVLVVHGLVDDAFYGSRAALLMFVPFAVLARVDERAWAKRSLRRLIAAAIAIAMMVGIALTTAGQAMLQANLGAVAQTRAELSRYMWPQWPIQDEMRRSPQINLGPAIARYQAALARSPVNAAANRRLGQIELSRGDYEAARVHLEQAYATNPGQRASRQLLGESYAIAGDVQRAAELWRTVDLSNGQLDLRVFWYQHVGEPQRADLIRQAVRLVGP